MKIKKYIFSGFFMILAVSSANAESNLFCDFKDSTQDLGLHFGSQISKQDLTRVWFNGVDEKPYIDLSLKKVKEVSTSGTGLRIAYIASDNLSKTYEVQLSVRQEQTLKSERSHSAGPNCHPIGYGQYRCDEPEVDQSSCTPIGYGQYRCEQPKEESGCYPIGYGAFKCDGGGDESLERPVAENNGHYTGKLLIRSEGKKVYEGNVSCLLQ
jgi:hypothetical protein